MATVRFLEVGLAKFDHTVLRQFRQQLHNSLPGVAVAFPVLPLPSKFDLAVIKPTDSNVRRSRFEVKPGGRFIAQRLALSFLVDRALHADNDDPIVGLAPWANSEYFDIVAQAPQTSAVLGIEEIRPMLHALLVERFKLATHTERQPVPIYELLALKPKMKKADPENRARCTNTPGPPPALSRTINCQNTTMAQFAAQLKLFAGSYIDSPVVDGTRIQGAWDFTFSFSPPWMLRSIPRSAAGEVPNAPVTSEPNGAITVFEALQNQLGLKLAGV